MFQISKSISDFRSIDFISYPISTEVHKPDESKVGTDRSVTGCNPWFVAFLVIFCQSSIIIPVPQKASTEDLNNYRPVVLTPIMKCFKETEDAITTTVHTALSHLEHQKS